MSRIAAFLREELKMELSQSTTLPEPLSARVRGRRFAGGAVRGQAPVNSSVERVAVVAL
jgi:hypothetical protein